MGVVYRARDKRLNRIVALKFVAEADGASAETLKRFRREAESIAALNHPNIATLYELGDWDGAPFLALEYLPGGTLASRRTPGGATHEDLARYASELGGALQFAHVRGILHRDVKPSNGMFSEHGVLKLVDFGLAKSHIAEDLTHTGVAPGTIGFMAPELLRGEEAGVRSDLYALGATLYEMAAGRPMIGRQEPLSALRPDLPAWFTGAIDRSVAHNPKDRFASVGEFLDCLRVRDAATGVPTQTMNAVPAAPKRRSRLLWMVVLLACLAVAAGLYFRTRSAAPGRILVVLPFENLGGDPANQPLCDGLQETVTGLLSMSANNLLVVPSSEVRRSQVKTIADARRQFRADLALTGSTQSSAGNLRLSLDLDDAATLRQKDFRIISLAASETDKLQDQLALQLASLLGYGSIADRRPRGQGETTSNSAAYSLYLQGTGAIENRRADDAVAFLTRAVQADAAFSLAHARLAEAYLWENTFTKDPKWLAMADTEVTQAAASGPAHETLMAQAMIRKATGDFDAAIRLFRQIAAAEPGNVEAWQLLAQTLTAANRPAEAEATLLEAIRMRPGYWPLHNDLGIFYMDRHDFARSEQAFLAASALAPGAAGIYSNLGALYFAMSRWSDAAASFEKSLSIKNNALAQSNLATVYFYQGKYEESAKHALTAAEMQPANPVNQGNLGDILWQIPARKEDAAKAFERAATLAAGQLSINPKNLKLRKSYALYLAKLGRKKEAAAQIDLALAQGSNDMNVEFYAARVFAVLGETTRAKAALGKCKALGYSAEEIQREPDLAALR
jgi:tetratricopeptide (TPR) repeat protein